MKQISTTAGNGNYFESLLNILWKNSGEKLVKLQDVNLILADFLSFESIVGYNSLETSNRRSWSLSAFYYGVSNSLFPSNVQGTFTGVDHGKDRAPRRHHRCRRRRRHNSQRLQIAKIRQKINSLMWFHEFFLADFSNLLIFPFPQGEFYTLNLSNCCRHKCGPSISRVFYLILGGFLTFGAAAVEAIKASAVNTGISSLTSLVNRSE